MAPLNILTWHVHGNYLFYLSHVPHTIYLPVGADRKGDYLGKGDGFPWGANVVEVPVEDIPSLSLDIILMQRHTHIEECRRILSPEQRKLPKIYIEHDPPQEHPTNTRHWVHDPDTLVVHVTHFNRCMWDNGEVPTAVIRHGVLVPDDARYSGELKKGIVVVNNLGPRGRRLGLDIFERVRKEIPLDLVGMGSTELGGLGELRYADLPYFLARYRFFFNPIRYTSLGLALCEAMTVGLPAVALATTEQTAVIRNGVSGIIDTDIEVLIEGMKDLLDHPEKARIMGRNAATYAGQYFHIDRFVAEWDQVFQRMVLATARGRDEASAARNSKDISLTSESVAGCAPTTQ